MAPVRVACVVCCVLCVACCVLRVACVCVCVCVYTIKEKKKRAELQVDEKVYLKLDLQSAAGCRNMVLPTN
jgi:hypothetical protein